MPTSFMEAGAPRESARVAGVVLHGRGGRAERMLDLAARLGIAGVRWVAPQADGGQWYPHRFMEPIGRNEPFLSDAVRRCEQSVVEAAGHGRLGPDRTVVVGFSQGACLATEFVLRHPGRCRALVVFTGGLIGPPGADWRTARGTLDGLHVLVTGSDVDEWVPEARVRETADVLTAFGARVQLRLYPGRPHVVSDAEVEAARDLIEQALYAGGTAGE